MDLCEQIKSIGIVFPMDPVRIARVKNMSPKSSTLPDGSLLSFGRPGGGIIIAKFRHFRVDACQALIGVPRVSISIKDYSDIIQSVQKLTINNIRGENHIDLEGIELLHHLSSLKIVGHDTRVCVNSLQGIEFCANFKELTLENVKTLSLAPLSGFELKMLVLKGTYRDLSSIKVDKLIMSVKDRAQLSDVLEKPGFVVNTIRLNGYSDFHSAANGETFEDLQLMIKVQEHIRQWNPTAVVKYVMEFPQRDEPETITLEKLVNLVLHIKIMSVGMGSEESLNENRMTMETTFTVDG